VITFQSFIKDIEKFTVIIALFQIDAWDFYHLYIVNNVLDFTEGMNGLVTSMLDIGATANTQFNQFAAVDAVINRIFLIDGPMVTPDQEFCNLKYCNFIQ
jgi:hypothetical protein